MMRKEYRWAVRERFSRGIAELLPGFVPRKVRSQLLFGDETVFAWEAGQGLLVFVLLVPDAKGRQSFTVELGWSVHNRFPEGSIRPSIILGPTEEIPPDLEEAIIRLGSLVSPTDLWWDLPDPALERPGDLEALRAGLEPIERDIAIAHAEAAVSAALDTLMEKGLPLLESVAAVHTGQEVSPRGDA